MINLLGKVVFESNQQSNGLLQKDLNLEYLSDGVYFLKVEGDGISVLRKIVKE